MALSQADRIAFSGNIVQAPAQAASVGQNKAAIQNQINVLQPLDAANANLMTAPNNVIDMYQPELQYIDGNIRTVIVEQDILDASNKKLGNHFFPNNPSVNVPSLAAQNNVWPQIVPYALGYCIGKNDSENYSQQSNPESTLIATILGYTTTTDPALVTASVNNYVSTLNSEAAVIPTTDTNPINSANNQAAISNIQTVILPALNAYLSASHPVATVPPSPDPAVTTLQAAVSTRQTFLSARVAQVNAILGSITQDISTGNITASSGAYGQRYNALSLRLNLLSGSLSQLAQLQAGISAQNSLQAGVLQNASTYSSFVPTSLFKADANNLNVVHVVNPSLFLKGDTVYIYADGQQELLRAIASINNDAVTLNDVVPSKYTVARNARVYKDAT